MAPSPSVMRARTSAPPIAYAAIALALIAPPVLVFPWLVDARDPTLYGALTTGFVLGFGAAILGVIARPKARTHAIVAVVLGLLVMLLALLELAFIEVVETVRWH